jgi:hypothetical protein
MRTRASREGVLKKKIADFKTFEKATGALIVSQVVS